LTVGPHDSSGRVRRLAVHDHASCSTDELWAIIAAVEPLSTLGDVLAWARTTSPVATVAEIVTQDEYTHDVVLEQAGRPYLAFDTT